MNAFTFHPVMGRNGTPTKFVRVFRVAQGVFRQRAISDKLLDLHLVNTPVRANINPQPNGRLESLLPGEIGIRR